MSLVDSSVLPLYSSGRQLQHWRNHHNRIPVRVSESETHRARRLRSLESSARRPSRAAPRSSAHQLPITAMTTMKTM